METLKTNGNKKQFDGLGLVVILFSVLLSSPLFYFLINLMLGNEHLFNGIIMQ